jgi:hypothetical protein
VEEKKYAFKRATLMPAPTGDKLENPQFFSSRHVFGNNIVI